MARGRKPIPLLVNGAIDTKTNPKLVQAPALLELENMYQAKTGELTPRNGFSRLTATASITAADNLFPTANGGLGTVARGLAGITYPQPLRYGNTAGTAGWSTNSGTTGPPYPGYAALISGVLPSATSSDAVDPDLCITSGLQAASWTDGGTGAIADTRELQTGRRAISNVFTPIIASGRVEKIAATGGNWMAIFGSTGTNINARSYSAGASSGTHTPVTDLDAALPWFDVKAIPGTSLFAIAWKVTAAGGVKCAIYNPNSGAVTATVTTAAADASFCLGWLDDQFATGNMYLATAGSAAGVIVRTMAAGTMVVSATNTIDATATTGIRNITGHLVTGATDYSVLWDVSGTSQVFDRIKKGRWTGAATVADLAGHHSLYSRSAKFPDGSYYVIGCLGSTVQPLYTLITCDSQTSSSTQPPQCHVLSGEAGPRRTPSSLASPTVNGSTVLVPLVRSRKIANPAGGTGSQARAIAVATFSRISKITHARELGGTVFIPGGMLQRDDGAIMATATFPIYPEAPTGTSAVGGAMTASGAYLYRVVFRAVDAAGRTYRSAGSVQFAITLGAGDGTVNLALMNLKMHPGDFNLGQIPGFGGVWAEVYRRGPAASGATLYNKVGEAAMSFGGGGDTVAFADTMSDATAASGEVAYFNGNVLENFNPPAHSVLEVNGNRVGIVNAEDPTEFWYSKEYKAGSGIGFNPLLKAAISGDGAGGMTALAAMDGRWILFKKTAIYVLSGDGPNDLGQGSFNQPQAVSRTVGTTNPSSILETPDGIMFQASTGGLWLLDRGLGLTYVGAPVEAYAIPPVAPVVGAALVPTLPVARFVTQTGRVMEWDYFHKRWYTHQLRIAGHTVVDCVNSSLFGWCYMLDDGTLMQEVSGALLDTIGSTTPIVPIVSFPHIQLAGLAGYQRLHAIEFTIEVLGTCTISVDAEYDHSGSVTGTPKTIAVTAATPTIQIEYNPPDGKAKCTSVRPVITVSGTPVGATFALTSATAYVTVKRGTIVEAGRRMI